MGGTNSKADVKGKKPEIKNYLNEQTRQQAQQMGVDAELLAYQAQKADRVDEYDQQRGRSKNEKEMALAEQEAMLQDRIEKAQADMEHAKKLREDMGIVKEDAPAPVETTVIKPAGGFNGSQIMSPKGDAGARGMNRQAAELQLKNEQANAHYQNNETPASSSGKASMFNNGGPMSPPQNAKIEDAEERKMQELRRIRAEAKQAEIEKRKRQKEADDESQQQSAWLASQATPQQPEPLKMKQQLVGGPSNNQRFDQDSEEEDDVDDMDAVRRSIPGQASFQMAKAQISTINYHIPDHRRSPKNIMAPDLGSSIGSRALQSNQKKIMIGFNNEAESQEDMEAQRNRNINLSELQSLLS